MKKILVIRFSSIGDIVLTSPVIRCLHEQVQDVEIHYLTKKAFAGIVESNPHITKVYGIEKEIDEVVKSLKEESYDFIVDLHRNLRTWRIKSKLRKPSATFPKLNIQKFMLTNFKRRNMPDIHVVDRYFKAVEKLNVKNDQHGLDYFLSDEDRVDLSEYGIAQPYIAFAIGAQFATKRLPTDRVIDLISKIDATVVLLGGPDDVESGKAVENSCENVVNLCGKLSLNQSAAVLEASEKVIAHDTGLMHIASAFNKPIVSIWGNTVPELGMYPYLPHNPSGFSIHEVKLSCRPCSKIGSQKCPKGHFNCMQKQDLAVIAKEVNGLNLKKRLQFSGVSRFNSTGN